MPLLVKQNLTEQNVNDNNNQKLYNELFDQV